MCIHTPETARIGKSEFNDIIEQCTGLHDRLLHCCRYFIGNKKKSCKQNLMNQLGYEVEDGNISCDCISNTTPEQDTNGGTTCVHQVECNKCRENRERQVKRKPDGTVILNWWRKGTHNEIGEPLSTEPTSSVNMGSPTSNSYSFFRNNAASNFYRRFYEYEGTNSIDHEFCTSIVNLVRIDAWVSVILIHNYKIGGNNIKGGRLVHRIIADYESMKIMAYYQIQEEIIKSICDAIQHEGSQKEDFLSELKINVGENSTEVCNNAERIYTICIPMVKEDQKWYYIGIKPGVVKKYLCHWIGNMKDCYVGKVKEGESELVRV